MVLVGPSCYDMLLVKIPNKSVVRLNLDGISPAKLLVVTVWLHLAQYSSGKLVTCYVHAVGTHPSQLNDTLTSCKVVVWPSC